ncbi:MAG: hypothetical protein GOMPHAMPRED_001647 [Gomphillus americanus]|uniref:DUF4185 domain-containing protein n=1 Tax=Gomphillus americanus TaxID=1940652 RepID=A0A8H3F623_9LECA|nr:MAG: hypothetical protein GOMPHAMPRED_001647 [Gomphillus americanus]
MHSLTVHAAGLVACLIAPALSHPTHSPRHVHHRRYEHDASPTISPNIPTKRTAYDLDGNGVPDVCKALSGTDEACEESNSQWITFNPNSPPTPTAKLQAPVIQTAVATASLPRGTLPSAATFQQQNGTKWTLTKKGVLQYSGPLGQMNLQGDKARTGVLGGQVIWNFGDMTCAGGLDVCGFDMGPAMYGTSSISTVNTQDITQIQDAAFIQPHASTTNFFANEILGEGCTAWGMDNSNVAALNNTHGIVLSWEQWRNCPSLDRKTDGVQDRGLGASVITLGDKFPTATRVSGLLAGGDRVAAGKLAIMAAEGYIYSYTVEDSGMSSGFFATHNMIVGRASINDRDIFSSTTAWEFYMPSTQSWVSGIPLRTDAPKYNLQTASGKWNCAVYGTVMWSNYFNKYMLFCDLLENEFNFYTADRPEGPWSEEYQLITGVSGYGSMVHPEYSEDGSHKALYISMGPDTEFEIWRVEFDYDA